MSFVMINYENTLLVTFNLYFGDTIMSKRITKEQKKTLSRYLKSPFPLNSGFKVLLLFISAFFLVACKSSSSDGDNSEPQTQSQPEAQTQPDPEPQPESQSGVEDKGDFTLTLKESSTLPGDLSNESFSGFQHFVDYLNKTIKLPARNIDISFKDCGVTNAFYSSDSTISMCYELFNAFYSLYDSDIKVSARAMLFVFFHEVSHGLAHQLDLPISGNKESAADSMASVFMAANKTSEGGLYAGYFFLNNGETEWTDVHPDNDNRFGDLACWAVGADPKILENSVLRDYSDQLVESGRDCEKEFRDQAEATVTLLKQFIKTGGN
jgi:hypothetical protein